MARAERDGTQMGQVWSAARRRARSAPRGFPWFAPFTALVSGEESDIESARTMIRTYLQALEAQAFNGGLHFHFWCMSFPHARWALYFQWLQSMGAWTDSEARELGEKFVVYQYTNFFYGMRTKPEPQCVDNQTMSLCYSNALIGHLFGGAEFDSAVARRMFEDGSRRLPGMLGGMPPSGYSGEGSTYMDYVVGPAIPWVVELLERTQGGNWFDRELPPNGGSAAAITRMVAREWMPNGLMLPWDHYGYSLPVRSCIAYAAHKTNDPFYFELLEKHASFTHECSIGWGYDDLIWTLIWWPETRPQSRTRAFASWAEESVGGALVSDDSKLYLMQMWDETEPVWPTRCHVNPNAVVLSAYGTPLTADGVPAKGCTEFDYDDTWREIGYMDLQSRKYNFGAGCAGAHSVLIVDGWEGMRAKTHYQQASLVEFDAEAGSIAGDVTPLYREAWPDALRVRRRSRLCADRFWLIEDLASFEQEHEVAARWWLRPTELETDRGVAIETNAGVRLNLLPLLGEDNLTTREVEGYPDRLDGRSVRAEWHQRGTTVRWLWLAWPEETREEYEDIAEGWHALADTGGDLLYDDASKLLNDSDLVLPFTRPADTLANVQPCKRWWYRRVVNVPEGERWWLRLPALMRHARLWVEGEEIDISTLELLSELTAPHVAIESTEYGRRVEVVVRCDVGIAQYGKDGYEGTGFSGRPAVLVARAFEPLGDAIYSDGLVRVSCGGEYWEIEHELLDVN